MGVASDEEDLSKRIRERNVLIANMEGQLAHSRARVSQMRAEVDRAKVEAKRARQEAEVLRERIAAAKPTFWSVRKLLPALAAVMMTAAVIKIAYFGYVHSSPLPLESKTSAVPPTHSSVATANKRVARGDPQFKRAMSRLQNDFYSLPEDESEIVRQINAKHPGGPRPCPLEWTNGAAALSLDINDHGLPPSLTSAVTQCADAVEKFRDEKESALNAAAHKAQ